MAIKVDNYSKPFKELGLDECKHVLDFFQLTIPASLNIQGKFQALRYTKSFNKIFPREYTCAKFLATFRTDDQGNMMFVSLRTTDDK